MEKKQDLEVYSLTICEIPSTSVFKDFKLKNNFIMK